MNGSDGAEFEALLDFLKRSRGFDFTGYKRATLQRRILKRMQELRLNSYTEYIEQLEAQPEEFFPLFNTVLINVTAFFRDTAPWDFLASDIIPRLLANKAAGSPIRVWSAGCASGQEAYSLAMILAEELGLEQFRERVKIYATDVDEEALNLARQAIYTAKDVADVPPALREKYFERSDDRYIFRKDLRRAVIFGRNDLIQDAPISRIDVLVSRNTLMYFNASTQAKILSRFHFALNDGGYLVLGRAETLLTHTNTFVPVDLKRRIFAKVPRVNYRDRLLLMSQAGNGGQEEYFSSAGRLRDAAFDASPIAQIVVDRVATVLYANEAARRLFSVSPTDLGKPLQDLEVSYKPVELRSLLDRAYTDRKAINVEDVAWNTESESKSYNLFVQPLTDALGAQMGATIFFTDVTAQRLLKDELEQSHHELEAAFEELQSTNEELETTNEELQSTVEELETTNEELQSTNEELETMNEELQSSNEELQTINDELRRSSDELNELNSFLESIFTSLRGAVIVLDADMHVLVWNSKAVDLWGLRADEVYQQHFLNLDVGLPVGELRNAIRAVFNGDQETVSRTLSATNRRGRAITCKVTVSPLFEPDGTRMRGTILVMTAEEAKSEKEIRQVSS
jgi:two-component system, chemotaxis family, CheB/CheR fusion protein